MVGNLRASLLAGGARLARPDYNLDLAAGIVPAPLVFARSGEATYIDSRGYLATAADGVPTFTYDPALEYNHISNPWFDGAGPGAVPTGMFVMTSSQNVTCTVVGTAVDDGVPCLDLLLSGTASGSSVTVLLGMDTAAGAMQAVLGDTMSMAIYGRLMSGTSVDLQLQIVEISASNTELANNIGTTFTPNNDPIRTQRKANARVLTNAATARVRTRVLFRPTSGVTYNSVIRIGFPQAGKQATPITDRVPLDTLAARIGTMPQYGFQWLELEPASQNDIPNSTADGAVVGTIGAGGSMPTGWVATADSVHSIVAVGVEAGCPYIDLRTVSAGALAARVIEYTSAPGPAALPADIRTLSAYCRLIAGSLTGVTLQHSVNWLDGAAAFLATDVLAFTPPSTGNLPACISSAAFTAPASTAYGRPRLRMSSTDACDFTLRISLPQWELSQYPTTRIPTISAAVVRNIATVTATGDFGNGVAGAMAVRMTIVRRSAQTINTIRLYAGCTTADTLNGMRIQNSAGFNHPALTLRNAGANVAVRTRPTPAADLLTTGVTSFGGGAAYQAFDGEVPVEDVTAASPNVPFDTLQFNQSNAPGGVGLRFVRIWKNRKLSATQTQRESARIV